MATPSTIANTVRRPVKSKETPDQASSSARYWSSLRKRVQAGASLRNVRPAPQARD